MFAYFAPVIQMDWDRTRRTDRWIARRSANPGARHGRLSAHERPDPSDAKTWDDLLPSEEKNTRGLEKIRHLPVATPAESLKHIAKPPKSQTRTRS